MAGAMNPVGPMCVFDCGNMPPICYGLVAPGGGVERTCMAEYRILIRKTVILVQIPRWMPSQLGWTVRCSIRFWEIVCRIWSTKML